MDLDTLRTLKRKKKELMKAEEVILDALVVDYQHNIQTDPVVVEKIFEISHMILVLTEKIELCREQLKKNKK